MGYRAKTIEEARKSQGLPFVLPCAPTESNAPPAAAEHFEFKGFAIAALFFGGLAAGGVAVIFGVLGIAAGIAGFLFLLSYESSYSWLAAPIVILAPLMLFAFAAFIVLPSACVAAGLFYFGSCLLAWARGHYLWLLPIGALSGFVGGNIWNDFRVQSYAFYLSALIGLISAALLLFLPPLRKFSAPLKERH